MAGTGRFFSQLQLFWSTFSNVKNETSVFNLVFKGFLHYCFLLFMQKIGYHDFPLKFFSTQRTRRIRGGSFLNFRKFQVSKKVKENRAGGCSTQTVRKGILLCFRQFLVSEEKDKGGYNDFPLNLFCFTVSEDFVGEAFLVSEEIWYHNFSCTRMGRRLHDLSS